MSKSFVIKPTTGPLDLRSEPEDVPVTGARYRLNMQCVQRDRQCRATGWTKFMDRDSGYNNHDMHSQLLDITGRENRRPINFMFEAESTLKQTMLLVGTDEALYSLNVGTGNYRVLSGTLGNWKHAAQNRDTIVLTNDQDEPRAWVFDTSDLQTIGDLQTLGVTKVGVVVTFRGVTFYMNVVQNGHTQANRILWSDKDNPLSLIPAEESLANDMDLDVGEAILNARPLGNILLIYTTRGIWQLGVTGGDEAFGASKRYDASLSSEGIMAYPRTLVSTGDTHVYLGQSGVYEYSLFESKPKLIEWVHRASVVMFDDMDSANCAGPVSGFDAEHHHIWISWVARGETLPARSLVLNTQFPFASIVDHGFTAFCQFMPREPVLVVRNFILDNCICTEEEFEEEFGDPENEGGQCEEEEPVVCEDTPDALFTTEELELEDGIVMEDWNAEEPSENSMCARLGEVAASLADLCLTESQSDQCNAARLFVMASAEDYCLKQPGAVYYRELCTGFEGCGTYETVGYKSILRSGPLNFKNVDDEKVVSNFLAEASVVAAVVPGQMTLRIGASRQALDPNLDCGIVWQEQVGLSLECQSGATEAEHLANNTRPDGEFSWPLWWVGSNLYYEIVIDNPNSDPVDIGAGVCFSKFVMNVDGRKVRY